MISLKLYAASPVVEKHSQYLAQLAPGRDEIEKAVRFVCSVDSTAVRRHDLRLILEKLGFQADDVLRQSSQ